MSEFLEKIRNGRTDLVFAHVAQGGAATDRDGDGTPLIGWCAYYGDVSAMRHLLDNGEQLAALGDNFDLNGAAFHGHWQLCQYLIENGADPNHRLLTTGETPLHAALSRSNRPSLDIVVAVLLDAGADPNAPALSGAETDSFMRDARTRGETPLHRAAAFGSENVVRTLLGSGALRNVRDEHGDTPLSWASWHLRPAAILRLLCFDGWTIHPKASWTGDHGTGWTGMDLHLLGMPHISTPMLRDGE